jgi:hypothetical protein
MWFSKKEDINARLEYNEVLKRLVNVETRLLGLELEANEFRNKILRKIQRKREPEDTESEVLNSNLFPKL